MTNNLQNNNNNGTNLTVNSLGISSSSSDGTNTSIINGGSFNTTSPTDFGQGPIQALWISTLPVELHEDLQDLGSHVMESYLSLPFSTVRRWLKGTSSS